MTRKKKAVLKIALESITLSLSTYTTNVQSHYCFRHSRAPPRYHPESKLFYKILTVA